MAVGRVRSYLERKENKLTKIEDIKGVYKIKDVKKMVS